MERRDEVSNRGEIWIRKIKGGVGEVCQNRCKGDKETNTGGKNQSEVKLHREEHDNQGPDRNEGVLRLRQILTEVSRSEASGEVENGVLELAPCAEGQFRRGTPSPDHPILNACSRRRHGGWGHQRDGTTWPKKLRARECLEIGLGEIGRGEPWHSRNDRSGHL